MNTLPPPTTLITDIMIGVGRSSFVNKIFFYKTLKQKLRNFTTNSSELKQGAYGFKTGILCISLLTYPFWSNGLQEAYWSFKYGKLNKKEILSDRFQWLHECMIVSL